MTLGVGTDIELVGTDGALNDVSAELVTEDVVTEVAAGSPELLEQPAAVTTKAAAPRAAMKRLISAPALLRRTIPSKEDNKEIRLSDSGQLAGGALQNRRPKTLPMLPVWNPRSLPRGER